MEKPELGNYHWAAVGAGRAAWRRFGGTSMEDAEGAALLALAECPRTFDAARWGGWTSTQCQGIFGNYVKRAAWNAAKRTCLQERERTGQPLEPELFAQEEDTDRTQRLLSWADGDPDKLAAVRAVMAGQDPRPSGARCRMMSSTAAARALRMADRRLRDLCDRGVIAAQRHNGAWQVPASEVSHYRHRRLEHALADGATFRAAQKVGRCSLRTVHRAATAAKCQRRRGRPQVHDHELLLSMLSDPIAHPLLWREEQPNIKAIARAVGCHKLVVQRLLAVT